MRSTDSFGHHHAHIGIILLSVLIGAALATVVIYHPRAGAVAVAAGPSNNGVAGTGGAKAVEQAYEAVADRVLPTVVSISVETRGTGDTEQLDQFFKDNPFFEPFFKERPNQKSAPRGYSMGSGWIYREDGYIVTNAHVVRDAEKLTVKLHDKANDGREYPATLVASDPKTELAVIKVNAGRRLPTLTLGDSTGARVGQMVFAVGAPFSLDQTFTQGVISAKGRFLPGQSEFIRIGDILQTDAPINPGNSGGPLVNLDGEVLGINVAIATGGMSRGNVGIGFAVSGDTAKIVVPQLIAKKKVARGWLGINIGDLNDNMRDFYGVPAGGVLVEGITEGGPAAASDLKVDDIIVAVNGKKVSDTWDLQKEVANTPPGVTVFLDVVRDKKPVRVGVKLAEMPAKYAGVEASGKPGAAEQGQQASPLGMTVKTVTPEIAKQLGLKAAKGVVVADVDQDGPAAGKLMKNDVITSVDRAPVATVQEFTAAIAAAKRSGRRYVIIGFSHKAGDEWMTSKVDLEPNW